MIDQEIVSQKIAKGAELVGSATMVSSGIGGWIAENHDIIYFTFGCVGAITALCGFIASLYYKMKADRRAQEIHIAKLRELTSRME